MEARSTNDALARRADLARHELAATEATLRGQAEAPVALEQSRGRATQEYEEFVDAKQRTLQDADAATRELVTRLTAMRQERDAAQLVRSLTETPRGGASRSISRRVASRRSSRWRWGVA